MMFKVLISEPICQEAIEYLEQNGAIIKWGKGATEQDIIEDIVDCDAVVVRLIKISQSVINAGKNLKIIAKHGVGCDSIDVNYAKQKGIVVINTPDANSNSVAEHTVALILSCAHQIVRSNIDYINSGFSSRNNLDISEINNKTIGLVGCGRIAKKVADILFNGFGMNVLGFDPFVSEEGKQNNITYVNSLDNLLKKSDYVSLHVPLRNETRCFMSTKQFSTMKKNAYLINTARGELIDNKALLDAINTKLIMGAALDVTYPEPINDKALLNNKKIILTQHIGASSKESMHKMGMETATNLVSFFSNK